MDLQAVLLIGALLGGLAIFIFGIHLMSDGLQQVVGDKMRGILAMLTSNPLIGALAGVIITIILQSSATTIVMVISFVNTRLMKLSQAMSVIIGANLGATVTSQITAFDIGSYAWIFVFVGFVMLFFFKSKELSKKIGQILMGFGIFFVGINTMGSSFTGLAEYKGFIGTVDGLFDMPLIGAIAGMLLSFVLHSSTAVIAMMQKLVSVHTAGSAIGVMGISEVVPIVLGCNVGVAFMTWLMARKASLNGKRAAFSHLLFNVFVFFILIWFISQISSAAEFITPVGEDIARQTANVHLLFNLVGTVIFLPLVPVTEKLIRKLIKTDDKENNKDESDEGETAFLDSNLINQPVAAMHMVIKELVRSGKLVSDMFVMSKKAFISGDIKEANRIIEEDKTVNILRERIIKYISDILAGENTTDDQKNTLAVFYHIASDIEHIGDYCKNIAALAKEKENGVCELSDKAYTELYECFDMVKKMMEDTLKAFDSGSLELAEHVMNQEERVDKTEISFRERHIKRLESGECSTAATVIYVDTLHNLERIGDSCSNIAEAVNKGYRF